MANVLFSRGKKKAVEKQPLKDGQVMIGTISDKTFAMYIDTKNNNGELIRVTLDLTEYVDKITDLEEKVKTLEEILQEYSSETLLAISDDKNILPDEAAE